MKKKKLFIACFIVAVAASTFAFSKYQTSAQADPYDTQCANAATGNSGPSGFGRFPSSVDLLPGQTAITTFRTYVCNASNSTIRDWTFTSDSSLVVETGRTNVIDFGPTGWSGPSGGFYTQDMGTFAPHEWRRRDVNMGIREAAFDGPGTYTIRVSGKGRIWDSSFGCFYPAPCYGETNTIQINLRLTVNRPDIACAGTNINPTIPELGQSFSVISNYAATDGSINSNYRLDAFLRDPSGTVVGGGPNVPYTVVNPNSLRYTFPPWTDTGQGGTYTITTSLSIPSAAWFDPVVCNASFNVADMPYHKVYGGDVMAGAAFGSPCIDTTASIIGWHDGPGPPNAGAGTQLAAFALNTIAFFASGQARAQTDFDNLAFANGGGYGGNLDDGNATCAPDYWAGRSGGAVPSPINPGDDGSFSHTGDLTLNVNPGGIGSGNRVTIYVEGNVYIQNDIAYQSTNFGSPADMSSFRLIVQGNIYVAPGVTQLNGLYVAIPTNANNGRVYTCGINAAGTFRQPTTGELNGVCRNQLTVWGAVVADLIKFTRSAGTLRLSSTGERFDSGGQPAEKFIYTPETWLTSDFNGGEELNSIRTLPPVL